MRRWGAVWAEQFGWSSLDGAARVERFRGGPVWAEQPGSRNLGGAALQRCIKEAKAGAASAAEVPQGRKPTPKELCCRPEGLLHPFTKSITVNHEGKLLLVLNSIDSHPRAGVPFTVMAVACTSGRAPSAGSTSRHKNSLSLSREDSACRSGELDCMMQTPLPAQAIKHPKSGKERVKHQ